MATRKRQTHEAPTRNFRWAKFWGIIASEGELAEGDVITIETASGKVESHTVTALVPFQSKAGKAMVRAFVEPVQ